MQSLRGDDQKIMGETKPSDSRPERVFDLDDYDLTLDIHDHPTRHPPIPYHYKGDEEFEVIPDAYYAGFMKKDGKGDYTEYWQAWNAYTKTTAYRQEITAHNRYKEQLALLRKKGNTNPADYLEVLKTWNKERPSHDK